MKRPITQQVLPALIMAGAAVVPIVTSAEIVSHALGGAPTAIQPSSPAATLPARSSSGSSTTATAYGRSGTYAGPVVNQPYGGVQATVTITGKRITDVAISAPQDNPRSAGINQQAVPLLRSETLQAPSANVNTVSGATFTSQAYAQSLQAALAKARSQGNAPAARQSTPALASTGQKLSVSVQSDD